MLQHRSLVQHLVSAWRFFFFFFFFHVCAHANPSISCEITSVYEDTLLCLTKTKTLPRFCTLNLLCCFPNPRRWWVWRSWCRLVGVDGGKRQQRRVPKPHSLIMREDEILPFSEQVGGNTLTASNRFLLYAPKHRTTPDIVTLWKNTHESGMRRFHHESIDHILEPPTRALTALWHDTSRSSSKTTEAASRLIYSLYVDGDHSITRGTSYGET